MSIYLLFTVDNVDINECQSSPCDQSCRNLPGSYACSCRRGYKKTYPHEQKHGKCESEYLYPIPMKSACK